MVNDAQVVNRWLDAAVPIPPDNNAREEVGAGAVATRSLAHSIVTALVDVSSVGSEATTGQDNAEQCIEQHALAIAHQSHTHRLSMNQLQSMLQGLQLSLLTECMQQSSAEVEQPGAQHAELPESLDPILNRTNQLVVACQLHMARLCNPMGVQSHCQVKTLQHEIRTPLQGALLNVELLLEDLSSGEPASPRDVHAIKKSVESAIEIVNTYAGRPAKDP